MAVNKYLFKIRLSRLFDLMVNVFYWFKEGNRCNKKWNQQCPILRSGNNVFNCLAKFSSICCQNEKKIKIQRVLPHLSLPVKNCVKHFYLSNFP